MSDDKQQARLRRVRENTKCRRAKYKKLGICRECGKQPARPGRTDCVGCNQKNRNRVNSRFAEGLCSCGKHKSAPGGKLCEDCKQRQRRETAALREEMFEHYGRACVCCGEKRYEFLQFDHIENDGYSWAKKYNTRGTGIYRVMRRLGYPAGVIQVLCANCNYAKAHYGYCPHHPGKVLNNDPNCHPDTIAIRQDVIAQSREAGRSSV